MKKIIVTMCFCVLTITGFSGDNVQDKDAIIKTARNYIDGWYEGNAERMKKALHPNLAKRQITAGKTGNQFLSPVSADALVEYTAMGYGKPKDGSLPENTVEILDVYHNMAMVKTVSPKFIDYIHLAKINGEWKIVNVLWEVNYEEMKKAAKK